MQHSCSYLYGICRLLTRTNEYGMFRGRADVPGYIRRNEYKKNLSDTLGLFRQSLWRDVTFLGLQCRNTQQAVSPEKGDFMPLHTEWKQDFRPHTAPLSSPPPFCLVHRRHCWYASAEWWRHSVQRRPQLEDGAAAAAAAAAARRRQQCGGSSLAAERWRRQSGGVAQRDSGGSLVVARQWRQLCGGVAAAASR